MNYQDVITFWFHELKPSDWFKKDNELDQFIKERFSSTLDAASVCELFPWRKTPEGRLAEVIVLDQFSRNIFRGQPGSFKNDPLALCLAQEAVAMGEDKELSENMRPFLYMPFMHSESKEVHKVASALFRQPGLENYLNFELKHKEIIDQFGRYPHRNEILGRSSTEEELAFLKGPNSSF